MFDDLENEINAMLKGKKHQKKADASPPKNIPPKNTVSPISKEKESPDSTDFRVDDICWGQEIQKSTSKEELAQHERSPKSTQKAALQKVELERVQRQANERLLRIQNLQNELALLKQQVRENQDNEERYLNLQKQHLEEKKTLLETHNGILQGLQEKLDGQEKHALLLEETTKECLDLRAENTALRSQLEKVQQDQLQIEGYHPITKIFHEKGLIGDEHKEALYWLIDSGTLPISHLHIEHYSLLTKILQDRCHVQASQIPLPAKSGNLYIQVPLERCTISDGVDIMEQARLCKDELLINGYTSVVIFGGQGKYESLFQILFAHHALQIHLAPALESLEERLQTDLIKNHQIAISFGGSTTVDDVQFISATSLGAFLVSFAQYLRTLS